MSERTYYVICDDNCRFESMTKEQIVAAIAQATGNTPTSVDDAFITKIKEKNAGKTLTFWAGTTAQYNAITQKDSNCIYIVTDDTTGSDIEAALQELQGEIDDANAKITTLMSRPAPNNILFSGQKTQFASSNTASHMTVTGLSKYSMVVFIVSGVDGAIRGVSSSSIICYKRTLNDTTSSTKMVYSGASIPTQLGSSDIFYKVYAHFEGDTITELQMAMYMNGEKQTTTLYLRNIIGIC